MKNKIFIGATLDEINTQYNNWFIKNKVYIKILDISRSVYNERHYMTVKYEEIGKNNNEN